MRMIGRIASFTWSIAILSTHYGTPCVRAGWPKGISKEDKEKLDNIVSDRIELPVEMKMFVKYKNKKGKRFAKKWSKNRKFDEHLPKQNLIILRASNNTALKRMMKYRHIEYVELVHKVQALPLHGQSHKFRGGRQLESRAEGSERYGVNMTEASMLSRGEGLVGYGINMTQASMLWDIPPAAQITICIVDSGYGLGHPDLPNLANNVTGTSKSRRLGDWFVDSYGHGTHVAGIIGAIGNNKEGVSGVMGDPTRFKFHIGKSLDSQGTGTEAEMLDAFKGCAGAKVISMSLGIKRYSETVQAACKDAYNDGSLIVAAAGNAGSSAYSYPASYPQVMAVAAVDRDMKVAGFSQFNDQVEIAGPGVDILSTITSGNGQAFSYDSWSGTSMATPYVAGVAALVWSYFPDCSNNQIRNVLIRTAKLNEDFSGCSREMGFGVVQAKDAYDLLKEEGCDAGDISPDPLSDGAIGGCSQDPQYVLPPTTAPTAFSCTDDDVFLLELTTDEWGEETSWELINSKNKVVGTGGGYRPSTAYVEKLCLPSDEYIFTIMDSEYDGICCSFGFGGYKVYYGGKQMKSGGQFGASDRVVFGKGPQNRPPTPPQASTPTSLPFMTPSNPPTYLPTTSHPTRKPTMTPTALPTSQPTPAPTTNPTPPPTTNPTPQPTVTPTQSPTPQPSLFPIPSPTFQPAPAPTTNAPTLQPKVPPTLQPTQSPTSRPTSFPTPSPTLRPTVAPTLRPTVAPTPQPTVAPTPRPTRCRDDPDWKTEKKEEGCESVRDSKDGCSKEIGINGLGNYTTASTSCPVTCGTCMIAALSLPKRGCPDDPLWRAERGGWKHGCPKVGEKVEEYCLEIGVDGSGHVTPASFSCGVTCGTC